MTYCRKNGQNKELIIIAEKYSIPLVQDTEKWRLRDGMELNEFLQIYVVTDDCLTPGC